MPLIVCTVKGTGTAAARDRAQRPGRALQRQHRLQPVRSGCDRQSKVSVPASSRDRGSSSRPGRRPSRASACRRSPARRVPGLPRRCSAPGRGAGCRCACWRRTRRSSHAARVRCRAASSMVRRIVLSGLVGHVRVLLVDVDRRAVEVREAHREAAAVHEAGLGADPGCRVVVVVRVEPDPVRELDLGNRRPVGPEDAVGAARDGRRDAVYLRGECAELGVEDAPSCGR